jgi:long-chain acyl-CoA synthetase
MEAESRDISFRLLSYNLNLLPAFVSMAGHRYKSERLRAFLEHVGEYEVLALQEVFSSPWLGGLLDRQAWLIRWALDHGYYVHRGDQPSARELLLRRSVTDSGLLILSRFPIVRSARMAFVQRGMHMDKGAAKGCIAAEIRVGSAHFFVFNTHLQATHSSSGGRGGRAGSSAYDSVRREQLNELRAFIQKEARRDGRRLPFVLTGDFNVDAISVPASADEYGYVYDNQNTESEEYIHLLRTLSPASLPRPQPQPPPRTPSAVVVSSGSAGDRRRERSLSDPAVLGSPEDAGFRLRDLLKEAHGGEHPPTRPPRLEFPSSMDLLVQHKYPQRLDYVFWADGACGPGAIRPVAPFAHLAEFSVQNRPYSHLSDHFGIAVTFVYEGESPDEVLDISTELRFADIFLADRVREDFEKRDGRRPAPKWQRPAATVVLLAVLYVAVTYALLGPAGVAFALFFMAIYLAYEVANGISRVYSSLMSRLAPAAAATADDDAAVHEAVSGEYDAMRLCGPVHASPIAARPACAPPADATLFDAFSAAADAYGYGNCLGQRLTNRDGTRGAYEWQSYSEVRERVISFGNGLLNLGVSKGDVIAVYASHCTEVLLVDLACARLGVVTVHVFDAENTFALRALSSAAPRMIVTSRAKTFRVIEMLARLPSVQRVLQIDALEYPETYEAEFRNLKLTPFRFVEQDGRRVAVTDAAAPVTPDDPLTIVFVPRTSSVEPRRNGLVGVVYTHRNVLASAAAFLSQGRDEFSVSTADVHYSYFPLTHVLERSVTTLMLTTGGSIGICQGDRHKFFDDVRMLRPTILLGVPGVFIRLHRKWKIVIFSWLQPRRVLFKLAFELKHRAGPRGLPNALTLVLDFLLFSRFRRSLGGRLRLITLTSDGLLPRVHTDFLRICFDCAVTECYSRNEFGLCTLSSPEPRGAEYAGYPTSALSLRLVDVPQLGFTSRSPRDGERGAIAVRGEAVSVLRWDARARAVRSVRGVGAEDTWHMTRDIGQWNANGSLTVLGQQRGILEPMKGHFVFNKYLENVYIESVFIQQIYITCKRYRRLVAIVVPDPEAVFIFARQKHIPHEYHLPSLCASPLVRNRILSDFNAIADEHHLRTFEYIAGIHIASTKFSVKNGCVLPDFNLNRDRLKKLFKLQLGELYRSMARAGHGGDSPISADAAADANFFYMPARRQPSGAAMPRTLTMSALNGNSLDDVQRIDDFLEDDVAANLAHPLMRSVELPRSVGLGLWDDGGVHGDDFDSPLLLDSGFDDSGDIVALEGDDGDDDDHYSEFDDRRGRRSSIASGSTVFSGDGVPGAAHSPQCLASPRSRSILASGKSMLRRSQSLDELRAAGRAPVASKVSNTPVARSQLSALRRRPQMATESDRGDGASEPPLANSAPARPDLTRAVLEAISEAAAPETAPSATTDSSLHPAAIPTRSLRRTQRRDRSSSSGIGRISHVEGNYSDNSGNVLALLTCSSSCSSSSSSSGSSANNNSSSSCCSGGGDGSNQSCSSSRLNGQI